MALKWDQLKCPVIGNSVNKWWATRQLFQNNIENVLKALSKGEKEMVSTIFY